MGVRPSSAAACPPAPTVPSIMTPGGTDANTDAPRRPAPAGVEVLGHPQPPDRHGDLGDDTRSTGGEEGGGGVFHRAGRGAAHGPGSGRRGPSPVVVAPSHSLSSSSSRNHAPRPADPLLPELGVPQLDSGRWPRARARRPRGRRTPGDGREWPCDPAGRLPPRATWRPTAGHGCGRPCSTRRALASRPSAARTRRASTEPGSPPGSARGSRHARMRSRNLAGRITLPLVSSECSYRPTKPPLTLSLTTLPGLRPTHPFEPLRSTLCPHFPTGQPAVTPTRPGEARARARGPDRNTGRTGRTADRTNGSGRPRRDRAKTGRPPVRGVGRLSRRDACGRRLSRRDGWGPAGGHRRREGRATGHVGQMRQHPLFDRPSGRARRLPWALGHARRAARRARPRPNAAPGSAPRVRDRHPQEPGQLRRIPSAVRGALEEGALTAPPLGDTHHLASATKTSPGPDPQSRRDRSGVSRPGRPGERTTARTAADESAAAHHSPTHRTARTTSSCHKGRRAAPRRRSTTDHAGAPAPHRRRSAGAPQRPRPPPPQAGRRRTPAGCCRGPPSVGRPDVPAPSER